MHGRQVLRSGPRGQHSIPRKGWAAISGVAALFFFALSAQGGGWEFLVVFGLLASMVAIVFLLPGSARKR